ncbi:hypothetical protein GND98_012725 [Clostridium butyricum]|uniref:Uncharacterized protein n=1 Tax=Clostridium butyricum TaxID=1492 RepID=A0A6L9EQL1_CLOBU|nr:hypothetical protein [Clostridium butyricum]
MEKEKIIDILEKFEYKKSQLVVKEESLDIGDVFIKDNKEVYIIVDKFITEELIEECKFQLLWYQNWCENEILMFNINIIFIYDSNSYNKVDISKIISKYERDSSVCRKLFIDLRDESDLDILPFREVNLENGKISEVKLKNSIIEKLKSEKLYLNLLNINYEDEENEKILKEIEELYR